MKIFSVFYFLWFKILLEPTKISKARQFNSIQIYCVEKPGQQIPLPA